MRPESDRAPADREPSPAAVPVVYFHERREISGGENSLLLLWEHLDRQRFRPLLVGPGPGPLFERARQIRVTTHSGSFARFRQLLTPMGWRRLATLGSQVRSLGAAIVHGNNPHTNLAAAWVGHRAGCRVVWHERTLPWRYEWDVESWARRLPDRIICNSAAVAQRFGGAGEHIHVIHNGVPLERYNRGDGRCRVRNELGLALQDVAIGIVGNLSARKNHELFLQAAAIVRSTDARFFVAGGEVFPENRGREAALRAQAKRLGLERKLEFLGTRQDMPAVMDALDIVASTCEVEACSRAIVEAMAAATPVVGADAGGNPELITAEETGLLFPAGDVEALASSLDRLANDTTLREAMGSAARAKAQERFGIEAQVSAIEKVYDELLGES